MACEQMFEPFQVVFVIYNGDTEDFGHKETNMRVWLD